MHVLEHIAIYIFSEKSSESWQLLAECRCLCQVPVPYRVLGSDLGRSWSALMLVTLDRSLPPSVRGFPRIDVSANALGDVIGIVPESLGVTHLNWVVSHGVEEEYHFLQFWGRKL